MSLFYQPLIHENENELDPEEARHAIRVMRLKQGDGIQLTDGKGKIYQGAITDITKSVCRFSIIQTFTIPRRKYSIHIGIAPTKNIDRTEWFVEKATELGVEEISFIQSKNSERKTINIERISKKVISALKQSGQAWLPLVNPICSFEKALDTQGQKFIAHVDQANPVHLKEAPLRGNYFVLVGPEGDFTQDEIGLASQKGFQKVSLGPITLRTETAGLAACHILNLINT